MQANGLPPRKRLSKAKLRALEAQQSKPRKSGKMRRMSAMTEEGGKAFRKRQLDAAGEMQSLQVCCICFQGSTQAIPHPLCQLDGSRKGQELQVA